MTLGFVDMGGGTRGIYGAGVLDYCLEAGISGDYFIGVSAGSANGASFLAGQAGRNLVFYNDYAFRKSYMGLKNFIRSASYINLDYIYSTLSELGGEYPLDYPALMANPMAFEIVATNALTGKPVYFSKKDLAQDHYEPLKASSCVPILCRPYPIHDIPYFDGGLSDPLPYKRALDWGCDKLIVILTKPKDFFRDPQKDRKFVRLLRRTYPQSAKALAHRAQLYNQSLKELLTLEKEGRAILIAPEDTGSLKTLTQDHDQLLKLYHMGKKDGEKQLASKTSWIFEKEVNL